MRIFSFTLSSLLTLAGMSLSAFGILQSEYKLLAVGMVLILGAAVFAMLFVGSRWVRSRTTE